jgi:hypothetical protein
MLKKYVLIIKILFMSVVQNAITPPILSSSITQSNTSIPLKKIPIGNDIQKDDAPKSELVSFVASPAGISPPDDMIGDVMPFSLFPLADSNHFEKEINNIAHVVEKLPKYDFKIQIINKIPTGIVKLEKL